MRAPEPHRPSRLTWYRGLLLTLAIALPFAVLTQILVGRFSLATLGHTLTIVVVYALCLGTLYLLAIPLLERRIVATRFPFDWLMFLAVFTLLTAFGSAVASFILVVVGVVPDRMNWRDLVLVNRLVFGSALLFGIFAFSYYRMKRGLEASNLQLQQDLEHGSRQLETQQQELERAREIQKSLLPAEIPQVSGFRLSGAWQPARAVGGDYFDVLQLSDRALAICIADVVGKGISAALLMSNLQAAVRAFAAPGTSPAEICGKVNRVIASHVADGKFITFFYALLDAQSGRLTYARAGHNLPIVARGDGSVLRLQKGGSVLGVFPQEIYDQGEISTAPGDRLLLFTDGVTEATNPQEEEFGEERLVSLVVENRTLEAENLQRTILSAITRFSSGPLTDDATLLVLAVL